MKDRDPKPATLTRRRFMSMVAAGSAALLASPAAASTKRARHAAAHAAVAAPGMSAADRKELARQKSSTAEGLGVIRKHAMPPGTELAATFRPLRATPKGS